MFAAFAGVNVAAPSAAVEDEAVTTIKTLATNYANAPRRRYHAADLNGKPLGWGYIDDEHEFGYYRSGHGTRDGTREIETRYVRFTRRDRDRCWTRWRVRFEVETEAPLSGIGISTVRRVAPNQLAYEVPYGSVVLTYDIATMLPTREVNTFVREIGDLGGIVKDFSYVTPAAPPRPSRVCKSKKGR